MKYKYPIVEIFSSIQGEGCNLGKRANFVRFAGCNLNCPWCDTDWSKANEKLTVDEILSRLDPKALLVVLTGGEPTLQPLDQLITAIEENGWQVAIETNGTNSTTEIANAHPNVCITCSPKPETGWHINQLCVYDELKYVVDDELTSDVLPWTEHVPIWLQPEGGNMQNAWQKALQIQKECPPFLDIRIGIQLHKIIGAR